MVIVILHSLISHNAFCVHVESSSQVLYWSCTWESEIVEKQSRIRLMCIPGPLQNTFLIHEFFFLLVCQVCPLGMNQRSLSEVCLSVCQLVSLQKWSFRNVMWVEWIKPSDSFCMVIIPIIRLHFVGTKSMKLNDNFIKSHIYIVIFYIYFKIPHFLFP